MSKQGGLAVKNDDDSHLLHFEDERDEKLQTIKRLNLRFDDYSNRYPAFLKSAQDLHDISEINFIENELSVLKDSSHLCKIVFIDKTHSEESSDLLYTRSYLKYLPLITEIFIKTHSSFFNSTERKIQFLQQRLKSITVADLEAITVLNSDKYDNSDDEIVHLDISATRHRLIFLYELGIIEMIERDYPIGTYGINTITTIVQSILNLPIKNTESIRSELGRLRNSKPQVKKKVLTDAAIKKLKIELSKIGIEPTKRI